MKLKQDSELFIESWMSWKKLLKQLEESYEINQNSSVLESREYLDRYVEYFL